MVTGSYVRHLAIVNLLCFMVYWGLTPQQQPGPNLQELVESMAEITPKYISTIDLASGFFQMRIDEESTGYTAFDTCFGTYKLLRLPQGLKTSSVSFQMLMDRVLGDLTFKGVLCYMDDLLVASPTIEEHLSTLQLVLDRLKKANLKLSAQKSKFAVQKCKFLGHVISTRGLEQPPDKLEVIQHYPEPKGIRDVRRLKGLFNWFRKFIPNMAVIAGPINKLYAQLASKAIFRARTYNCIIYSVR